MRESITIEDKTYELTSNAYTPIAYKEEFGKDYFQDLFSMIKSQALLHQVEEGKELKSKEIGLSLLADFDLTFFHRLFWVFVKSANPRVKPYADFFREMESFPLEEVAPLLMKLLNQGMVTKKKSMKAQRLVKRSLP